MHKCFYFSLYNIFLVEKKTHHNCVCFINNNKTNGLFVCFAQQQALFCIQMGWLHKIHKWWLMVGFVSISIHFHLLHSISSISTPLITFHQYHSLTTNAAQIATIVVISQQLLAHCTLLRTT